MVVHLRQRLLRKLFSLRAALLHVCAAFNKAQSAVPQTEIRERTADLCFFACWAGVSYLPRLYSTGKSSGLPCLADFEFLSVHF